MNDDAFKPTEIDHAQDCYLKCMMVDPCGSLST